eukprot:CAMPEP_0195586738 /NCGR_PEP_ID=MMETSP0814-20130614/29823_1 /TAXON_ID=97485 /ORGANISM="Prymnesium parvum, Strain Texoma1" /LENGTH=134 /DNA_ID=CAMNT_0040725343 /DNA_START=125 /DNA_END=527 /DNA_ORIENTATION=-
MTDGFVYFALDDLNGRGDPCATRALGTRPVVASDARGALGAADLAFNLFEAGRRVALQKVGLTVRVGHLLRCLPLVPPKGALPAPLLVHLEHCRGEQHRPALPASVRRGGPAAARSCSSATARRVQAARARLHR